MRTSISGWFVTNSTLSHKWTPKRFILRANYPIWISGVSEMWIVAICISNQVKIVWKRKALLHISYWNYLSFICFQYCHHLSASKVLRMGTRLMIKSNDEMKFFNSEWVDMSHLWNWIGLREHQNGGLRFHHSASRSRSKVPESRYIISWCYKSYAEYA